MAFNKDDVVYWHDPEDITGSQSGIILARHASGESYDVATSGGSRIVAKESELELLDA